MGFFDTYLLEPWLTLSRWLTTGILQQKIQNKSAPRPYDPVSGKLLYIAASALPYHISGYTTRTQALLSALSRADGQVVAVTRPGYPWDRSDRCCNTDHEHTTVHDMRYSHLQKPRNTWPVVIYALLAAKAVAKIALAQGVSCIHAASNHVNALPALLAARQLGIPFHYEMRGLWELTRVSRQPGFEHSQAYKQGLALESLVARSADRLFVISDQLGHYLTKNWGVPPEHMHLLPNCVTPEHFNVALPSEVEPNTIGYAGSLICYEGLDTLIWAVARLKTKGHEICLRIAGEGEARAELLALVQRLDLADHVQFLGRLAPEAARKVILRSAVVCLPRKPFEVCHVVPPIKLVEALAMGKPVIVPDLPVFRDELGPDPGGWFFRAGDPADLAGVIEKALADPAGLTVMGAKAREYVLGHRTWDRFMQNLLHPQTQVGADS